MMIRPALARKSTSARRVLLRSAMDQAKRASSSSPSAAATLSTTSTFWEEWTTPLAFVVGATTAVAATAVAWQQMEEEEQEQWLSAQHQHDHPTALPPQLASPLFVPRQQPLLLLNSTTQCEYLMPSSPVGSFLTRAQTVEYMDRMAVRETTLHQKYRLNDRDLIGVGSFGAVTKAVCKKTDQVYAVKRLPKESTSSTAVLRELQALCKIQASGGHPHLCALREHFDEADSYYLVMDLVAGGELFEALCRHGPLPEADAARLCKQISSALQYLHALNLVHADLKPENCMLTTNDTAAASVQLVDFGCCTAVTDTTDTKTTNQPTSPSRRFWGSGRKNNKLPEEEEDELDTSKYRTAVTPAYCPPEVLLELRQNAAEARANGQANSVKSPTMTTAYDMWSLGCILFVMLIGAHPFDLSGQCTDEEMVNAILDTRLLTKRPEWKDCIKDLSPEVQELLHGLLHPDPKQRFTAEQLLASPWVRGLSASSKKVADRRLLTYQKHQTRVAAQFFKQMLQHHVSANNASSANGGARRDSGSENAVVSSNTSLLETAFSKLDPEGTGYISSKDLHGDKSFFGADAKLNLAEATEVLSDQMKELYFPAGHTIYNEGDPGDIMYFVVSGTVTATSHDGFTKTKQAGDFFGEDVLSEDESGKGPAYAFTSRCVTPVHALQVNRKDYNKYMQADEDLAYMMKEKGRLRRREHARVLLGMSDKVKVKELDRGDLVFSRGSDGDTLYILLNGAVDISVDGHKVRSLGKGEMTGEHAAFYGHKPYNVTAQCMSDKCSLGALPGKELRKALDKNKVLRESFHDIIMRRDFKKALCAHLQRPFPETEAELRSAFTALVGEEKDGKDEELGMDHLRKLMMSFDPTYIEEDIVAMLKSMDLNGSQSLTWPEFKAVFGMSQES